MTRGDGDRVSEIFTSSARDVTPACARHVVCVLYAPVSHDPEMSRQCASVLTDIERRRADRFARECERALFIQRRAFRRFCGATALGSSRPLSQIVFEETEKGRPYLSDLPDVWFSFSSCRFGYIGAWSPTHGIGTDLEDQTRTVEIRDLADQYYSGAEVNAVEGAGDLERLRTFFQLWNLKEAALKSIGEGLSFGLDAFEFELDPEVRVGDAPLHLGGPDRFTAHVIEGTDGCAALVIRRPV